MKKKKILSMVLSLMLAAMTVLSFNYLVPAKATAVGTATLVFHEGYSQSISKTLSETETVNLTPDGSHKIEVWGNDMSMQGTTQVSNLQYLGWTNSNTSTSPMASLSVDPGESIDLYALYKYDVTVSFYDGTDLLFTKTIEDVIYNTGETKPTQVFELSESELPYKLGYAFEDWSAASNIISVAGYDSVNTNINKSYYAVWKECDTYILKYNANGGSGTPADQEQNVGESVAISSTIPTRMGYTFDGWNTQSDGNGTGYDAGESYSSSAKGTYTLYAQWSANDSIFSTILRVIVKICNTVINFVKNFISIIL